MTPLNVPLLLEGVWCLSVGLGVWNNDYPRPKEATLPFLHFDLLLRRIGPLLPFVVFALRALFENWLFPRSSIKKADEKQSHVRDCVLGARPNLWDCFGLYVCLTLIRIGLYVLHLSCEWFLLRAEVSPNHLLSDHIVLAASLVAILKVEIAFLLEGLNERNPLSVRTTRKKSLKEALAFSLLFIVLSIALLLFGAVCGDMYYTAMYFHPRMQSLTALCVGFGFQMCASVWLNRCTI